MERKKFRITSSAETVMVIVIAFIAIWSFMRLTRIQFIILMAIIAFIYFKTRGGSR